MTSTRGSTPKNEPQLWLAPKGESCDPAAVDRNPRSYSAAEAGLFSLARGIAIAALAVDNRCVSNAPQNAVSAAHPPFHAGTLVVVALHSPKEKFWGVVLELTAAGVSVCGTELNSFEDFTALVKAGEASPSVVFFPMHRVERLELDARNGMIPALGERFAEKTGSDAVSVLAPQLARRAS